MILVTGASGHLGRHLVKELLEQGEKVRVFVRSDPAIEGTETVHGDVLDPVAVSKAVEGIDTIYHLAAAVDYKQLSKKLLYDVNVTGTRNILEKSKAHNFIYMSSTSVYGYNMKENPASEKTQTNPSSDYGKTKAEAEKLVILKGGMVIRAPVIYGSGFNQGFGYVLSQIQKEKMVVIGDGKNRMQWVHVDDLVHALILTKDKGKSGETYLIAGKDIKTQEELYSMLAKHLGVSPPTKRVSTMLARMLAYYKTMKAGMAGKEPSITSSQIERIVSDRTFDISKAVRELGFDPKINYEKGAEEMVSEYRKNFA